MKRILCNSKLKKIFIILLAAIMMLQFMMPNYVFATTDEAEDGSILDGVGGILLKPVFFLFNFVADSIIGTIDNFMTGNGSFLIPSVMKKTPETFEGEPNYKDEISVAITDANYPKIGYSPETIFSGKVPILSIDFISDDASTGPLSSVRTSIASWYKALRLFAIVGLLSVLIYTGIKIIISSNAKDKAKYKEWIINWFIAVAILFCMHYIMSFIITVTDEINNLLSTTSDGIKAEIIVNGETKRFKTNLIGLVRYMVQTDSFMVKIGYEAMYIALIVYTIKFTVVYLKRVLNMAFLTLIAPIVALMYPIDKMTDGSAQGFDMWLKEYIFNALLQPMHYIMYYILVSSAIGVAASNPIYGIVVLMFMTEAEKLLKKIFGFDKAHGGTVGGMANAFAAGALVSSMKNLSKMGKGGNTKGGTVGQGNAARDELPKPKKDTEVEENFSDSPTGRDSQEEEEDNDPEDQGDSQNQGVDPTNNIQNQGDPANQGNPPNQAVVPANQGNPPNQSGDPANQGNSQNQVDPANQGDPSAQVDPASQGNPSGKGDTESQNRTNRFAQGAKAVGKKLWKPIWDSERSRKYNTKRWIRRAGRLGRRVAGATVGVATAAVQAGISITDGKYSFMEGIASYAAGSAGGRRMVDKVANGVKGIGETFSQGYHSGDDDWEEEQRKRYYEDWVDRDDVNKVFKEKFEEDQIEDMKVRAKEYTYRGYNDPKEVAKLMKSGSSLGWDDKKTIATMNFKKRLQEEQSYGALHDKDKQDKYIASIIENRGLSGENAEKLRNQYKDAFKSVAELNKKMR